METVNISVQQAMNEIDGMIRSMENGILTVVVLILLAGCSKTNWSYYWPYSNLHPSKVQKQLPMDYEECINYLDTILKNEAKEYFKNQDSIIAVMEISEGIGGFFIKNWYLDYFISDVSGLDGLMKLPDHAPGVARLFTKAGIVDPEAMMRVVFSCYFRKLNGLEYDWNDEINKIKNYWPNPVDQKLLYQIRQDTERKELGIRNRFFFNRLSQNDSVIIFFNRPPLIFDKKPNAYFVTGIVNFKRIEQGNINVRVTDIISNMGTRKLLMDGMTIQVGDTMTGDAVSWHKKDIRYFNYSSNAYYPNKAPSL